MTGNAYDTPVVIVGGGPAGSAVAVELGLRGIHAVVLEKTTEIDQNNPRGGNNTMRTLEHYRRWGISDALHRAAVRVGPSGKSLVPSNGERILYTTGILGEPMGTFTFDWGRSESQSSHISAERSASVNQPKALAVLRPRATELGADYRFGAEFLTFTEDESGIDVVYRDLATGTEKRLRTRYLVGADSSWSAVRKAAGIERSGHVDSDVQAVMPIVRLTEIDNETLFGQLRYRMNGFLMVANERIVSNASPVDERRWRFTMGDYRGAGEPSEEEVLAAGKALFGKEIGLEVDSFSSYRSHIRIADRYSKGRVFIAGDACHVFPPAGGHNQNLGIGDAVNLGWKMAAVLKGWAGPALLDSYDAERRPEGWRVGMHSFSNARNTSNARKMLANHLAGRNIEDLDEEERFALGEKLYRTTYPQWHAHGVVLDIRYTHSPVIVDDGSEAPEWEETEYRPFAKPGHRAPHFWLAEGRALYDAFGPEFTLLALPDAKDEDIAAIETEFAASAVPLAVLRLDRADIAEAYGAPLVLVRPDQQIAWRGADAQGIASVAAIVTGHDTASVPVFSVDAAHLAYLVAYKNAA